MDSSTSSSENPNTPQLIQVDPPSGLRSLVVPAVVVIVGLAIAGMLFAHFGKSKPDATGTILREVVYPVQVDPGVAPDQPGMAGGTAEQDETIVLVEARVTNVSQKPLTIFDIVSDVLLNQADSESSSAMPDDIDRLFQRFPDLASMRMQPLSRHEVIAPGNSAEGLLVFNYPWTKQQWDQHTQAQVVVSFQNGRSVVLPLQK
ncbi:MAG: hypothetical protein ACYDC6_16355 [Acidobacteriaceae bacterium]